MTSEYLTTPWQNQNSRNVLQELKKQGLDAEIEANGKFAKIKLGKKTITVDLSQPIWIIMAEIGKAESENKQQELKNDMQTRANNYHKLYEEKMEKVETNKKKRNIFLTLWKNAKQLFNKILGKNKVETVEQIQNSEDKKLAVQYSNEVVTNKFGWIRAGNDILSDCNDALGYALNEGEWSTRLVLA